MFCCVGDRCGRGRGEAQDVLQAGERGPGGERVRGPRDHDAAPPEGPGDQEDAGHARSDAAETQLRTLSVASTLPIEKLV